MAQQTLAEQAVDTLAEIKRMDFNVNSDSPERYAIHLMKQAAEEAVSNGLRLAMQIVWAAKQAQDTVEDIKTAAQKQ